jgi:hypothetical protein
MKLPCIFLLFFTVFSAFAQKYTISGVIDWEQLQIKADVSLNLASAGISLPTGRYQGEALINSGYVRLIRPGIMGIQADSSSTVGDLLERGELNIDETQTLITNAVKIPPAVSADLKNIFASYILSISSVTAAILRHDTPAQLMRTLTPLSSVQYTGIIIIANEKLPIYGRKTSANIIPCLFPKIWDTDMNLIYEHAMLTQKNIPIVRYCGVQSIFQNNPSGLTNELQDFVGDKPLRIIARATFGVNPTDVIIDHEDALKILSSVENRNILSQGKIAIIIDDSVLKQDFR